VSNAHYQQCVAAGQCTAPKETNSWTHYPYYGVPAYANYPVINVTWNQAAQYCQWLGKRLPTEAEWEFAARGSSGNRVYPWGDTAPDCSKVNYGPLEGQCVGDAAPVGSYPAGASSFGVLDMSGNVWEWVSDWYSATYYAGSPAGDPTGPATGTERVMRGGAWNNYDVLFLRVARRGSGLPDYFADSVGFRCAQ